MGDIIVISALALVVFLVIFFQIRSKKKGKSCPGCSGCCAGCTKCPGKESN